MLEAGHSSVQSPGIGRPRHEIATRVHFVNSLEDVTGAPRSARNTLLKEDLLNVDHSSCTGSCFDINNIFSDRVFVIMGISKMARGYIFKRKGHLET